jgi:hypothetical protein
MDARANHAAALRAGCSSASGWLGDLDSNQDYRSPLIRIRLQSSSTTHHFGPIAERHGPADPEPFVLRSCDLVTHALAVVAKSACES